MPFSFRQVATNLATSRITNAVSNAILGRRGGGGSSDYKYLNEASQLGDELHVIVNNDYQASLKKGRSFMREDDRLEIVRSLKVVDKLEKAIDDTYSKQGIEYKKRLMVQGIDI